MLVGGVVDMVGGKRLVGVDEFAARSTSSAAQASGWRTNERTVIIPSGGKLAGLDAAAALHHGL